MASLLAVPANEGLRSARLGGTGSLGHRRAPGACRPVENGWVGYVVIAGRRPRCGASRRRASPGRPCASQQGWRRSAVWVSSQRKLAEHRAAVPQLRQASLTGGSACAVGALPSSQTASHAAPAQGRAGPQRVPRPGFRRMRWVHLRHLTVLQSSALTMLSFRSGHEYMAGSHEPCCSMLPASTVVRKGNHRR